MKLTRNGKVVEVGDVVRCMADEPWVFSRILDAESVEVLWDDKAYIMPTLALGCKVVPTVKFDA